jgi:anti-sigma factor RsiW
MDQCPDDNILAAYVSRNLPPDRQAAVEAHIARCRECCEVAAFVLRCEDDLPDFPFRRPPDQ